MHRPITLSMLLDLAIFFGILTLLFLTILDNLAPKTYRSALEFAYSITIATVLLVVFWVIIAFLVRLVTIILFSVVKRRPRIVIDGKSLSLSANGDEVRIMYAGPDEKICILSTNLNGGTRSIMSLSNSDATLQSLRTRNYIFNWKSDAVLFFDKVLSRVGNVPFKEFTEHMELSVCWHSLKSAQGYSQDVVSFDYVQTDKLLLTLCNSGIVKLWDTTSGEQKIEFLGHEDRITAASFSECGRRVITGSRDGTVHVWDIAKGKQISSIHIGDEVQSAFFLDACDNIAALTRESVFFGGFSAFSIWNLQFGVRKLNIVTHSDETIVSFSPDKKLLLSLSNLGDLRIRSTKTGRILGYSLGFRRFTGIIAGEKNYKILALNPNYCEVIPFQPAKSGWILI